PFLIVFGRGWMNGDKTLASTDAKLMQFLNSYRISSIYMEVYIFRSGISEAQRSKYRLEAVPAMIRAIVDRQDVIVAESMAHRAATEPKPCAGELRQAAAEAVFLDIESQVRPECAQLTQEPCKQPKTLPDMCAPHGLPRVPQYVNVSESLATEIPKRIVEHEQKLTLMLTTVCRIALDQAAGQQQVAEILGGIDQHDSPRMGRYWLAGKRHRFGFI
ncbi:MAG TPA: hypothetical protein VGE69_02315, partial [Pseudomonadales bacterium]